MGQRILSEIDIPSLAEAMRARGYALVVAEQDRTDDQADVAAVLRRWSPGIILDRSRIPEIAVASCRISLAAALDAGAADAVAIPVDPGELAARGDARLRRHHPRPIQIGDLRIDPAARRVWRAGQPVDLVPREFALLLHLAERSGDYVSRTELLTAVWKLKHDPGTNIVAVHVSNLRRKIDRGRSCPIIHGARGLGYRIDTG